MQLGTPNKIASIRGKLSAAACVLLASGIPGRSVAAVPPATTLDASLLVYGEQSRAKVTETLVRVTRLFSSGQSLSAQIGVDVITGASPTGAMPTGLVTPGTPPSGGEDVQTVTTASGGTGGGGGSEPDSGQIPVASFSDTRVVLDANWQKPFGRFLPTLGGHYSLERDYQSIGANALLSVDLMHKLTTLTLGGAINRDEVFPTGGTRLALSDSIVIVSTDRQAKNVTGGMVGLSRILTRRWMLGANVSRTFEEGYLTDPYKVVSLMDPVSGLTVGQLTESRPDTRTRSDILGTSVYHLSRDVLYLSYRYYWDDWGVRSNTADLKYRHELQGDHSYLQPHLRYYTQTEADFFQFGLIQGAPVPLFVSADERLGPLRTVTVGATYGFTSTSFPGEWTLRAEYVRQFGDGYPSDVVGVQQNFNLFPPVNIGSLVAAYTVTF